MDAFAYNDWISSFKNSWFGSLLIVGRVLMTDLETTMLIFFGFKIVHIVGFPFLRTSLHDFSFVGGVVC